MRTTLEQLLRLAIEAFPQMVFPETPRERNGSDDEGSERQISAENIFTEALEDYIGPEKWLAYDRYCLKATCRERVKEGIRLAVERPALSQLIVEYRNWITAQGLPNLGSADEHHHDETLSEAQRTWLKDFSRRWDSAEE